MVVLAPAVVLPKRPMDRLRTFPPPRTSSSRNVFRSFWPSSCSPTSHPWQTHMPGGKITRWRRSNRSPAACTTSACAYKILHFPKLCAWHIRVLRDRVDMSNSMAGVQWLWVAGHSWPEMAAAGFEARKYAASQMLSAPRTTVYFRNGATFDPLCMCGQVLECIVARNSFHDVI